MPPTMPTHDHFPARPTRRPYLAHPRPLFFAHRGGSALAPENTLPAFANGAAFGADALELDIQRTRDDHLVVIHDPTVDRVTNAIGPVAAYTLAQLQRLDAGYRFSLDGGLTYPYRDQGVSIPTLRSIYEHFPTLRINIDLKESDIERERLLWRLIQELAATDRTLVASGDQHAPIVRFRRLCAHRVATSASASEIRNFHLAHTLRLTSLLRPAYDALQVPETYHGIRIVTPASIATAHQLGLALHVWTIDDPATMRRLLDWGVDGIMTDRPDLLATALATYAPSPA